MSGLNHACLDWQQQDWKLTLLSPKWKVAFQPSSYR
jgi:hypothetical protein